MDGWIDKWINTFPFVSLDYPQIITWCDIDFCIWCLWVEWHSLKFIYIWNLTMWPCLEIEFLYMQLVKMRPYWIRMGPKFNITLLLIKRLDIWGDCSVKIQTEIRTKERQDLAGPPETRKRSGKIFLWRLQRKYGTGNTLTLDFWPPELRENTFPVH